MAILSFNSNNNTVATTTASDNNDKNNNRLQQLNNYIFFSRNNKSSTIRILTLNMMLTVVAGRISTKTKILKITMLIFMLQIIGIMLIITIAITEMNRK